MHMDMDLCAPYPPVRPPPLPTWKVYLIGCAVGAFVGWFVTFYVMSAKTPEQMLEQERQALERKKAALQTTITALDTYYRMLTNGTLKPEKGQ